jgi:hypothetical protein
MGTGRRGLVAALISLAGGHLLAMAAILFPFAALTVLVTWQFEIRITAGLTVICAGMYLLLNRRHPRFLARIKPAHLALWSFAAATAHGAGLMLVPIYLGLCRAEDVGANDKAAGALISGNLITAINVAATHAAAMVLAGAAVAFAVYEWLGLKFITRSWFNLETLWALSLIGVGSVSLAGIISAL